MITAVTSHMTYKLGVVGLGVMGANLARNADSQSFPVAGYDLDAGKRKALSDISGGRIATPDAPERLMALLERTAGPTSSAPRDSVSSAWACPAARKARCTVRR